jgi:hypothetical protein
MEPVTATDQRPAIVVLDEEPTLWFLLSVDGALHLDARYSYSAIIDDAALLLLDERELAAHRARGHDYLSELAHAVHMSAPYLSRSPYFDRDCYRQDGGAELRTAVIAAIVARRKGRHIESP